MEMRCYVLFHTRLWRNKQDTMIMKSVIDADGCEANVSQTFRNGTLGNSKQQRTQIALGSGTWSTSYPSDEEAVYPLDFIAHLQKSGVSVTP